MSLIPAFDFTMSCNRFVAGATNLVASGCTGPGSKTLTFTIDIGADGVLRCAGVCGSKFRLSVNVGDALLAPDGDWKIRNSQVECVLDNDRSIMCEGVIDPFEGTLRLDATDGRYSFFWFSVHPRV